MSDYVSRVSADLQQRYAGQPEYLQAVLTWLEMIAPALEDNPIYERVDLLTRMVEPDLQKRPDGAAYRRRRRRRGF